MFPRKPVAMQNLVSFFAARVRSAAGEGNRLSVTSEFTIPSTWK